MEGSLPSIRSHGADDEAQQFAAEDGRRHPFAAL
jgi:hypothetical protein